jgi:aminoglycoside 6'-N-acetyltransferase I
MEIRAVLPTDAAEWLRMRRSLWPESGTDTHAAEIAEWRNRPDAIVLVLVRPDGRLAGFAEVGERSVADGCTTTPVAYLEGWYIDPDLRRSGYGTALVRVAEGWARARGYREFASDVELSNVISQHAHEALGFAETSRSVLYRKTL